LILYAYIYIRTLISDIQQLAGPKATTGLTAAEKSEVAQKLSAFGSGTLILPGMMAFMNQNQSVGDKQARKIYVGNLPPYFDENELKRHFSSMMVRLPII
jgi:hypothetical protein